MFDQFILQLFNTDLGYNTNASENAFNLRFVVFFFFLKRKDTMFGTLCVVWSLTSIRYSPQSSLIVLKCGHLLLVAFNRS